LLAVVGFFLLYLAVLSLFAAAARRQKMKIPSRLRRFAVCVPAHNEEGTIEKTLRGFSALEYPKSSFDVIVVADNCSDATANSARALNAQVLERTDDVNRGKGYALRWCFDQLLTRRPAYDAVVVVDADSILSENFLNVMNSYLETGAEAIQSSDMVEPRPEAWSVEVTRIGFTLYNIVRPLGRRLLGCSAGLRGNGMCFSMEVLRRIQWEAYSLNEDLEYGLRLLMNGVRVVFAPEARVLATMPQDPRNAESQRARWEIGRYTIIRNFARPLLRTALKFKSFRILDAFIDLVIPPLVNLLAIAVLMLCVSVLLWVYDAGGGVYAILWLLVLALGGLHMIVGLYAAGADRSLFRALAHVPRYVLWKLRLYLRLAQRRKPKDWVRTTREISMMHHDRT
jgi:cellulose synthase/poly-beta-1,6-N-acetylglucosamine synthase-like glycosyltransferase